MKIQQSVKRLAKFILYVLGRRPDEFGLLPDSEGYLKIKELLKALSEEEGWRHVRRSHLDEILLTDSDPGIEIEGGRIRARSRQHLPKTRPADAPPKLLYTCVRRRAYGRVQAKGLHPAGGQKVILTVDPEMALRLGRRKDNPPVMLTVQVQASLDSGTRYAQFGEHLYLADFIPAGCFQGPPLPREKPAVDKKAAKPQRLMPTDAGTFHPDPFKIGIPTEKPSKKEKGKKRKDPAWKKERRRRRKEEW
jgi:putative RNA 2'-phosphotransferase